MKITREEQIAKSTNLLDVLLLLRDIINDDIHVASFAYVTRIVKAFDSTKGYGIAEVKPFPLKEGQDEYLIQAYTLSGNLNVNDRVLVLFTDLNFISSLDYEKGKAFQTEDLNLHSIKFGVILGSGNSVSVSATGSSTNEVKYITVDGQEYLIKGEKGDKGDTGDTGPTGPQGPQGPAGVTQHLYEHHLEMQNDGGEVGIDVKINSSSNSSIDSIAMIMALDGTYYPCTGLYTNMHTQISNIAFGLYKGPNSLSLGYYEIAGEQLSINYIRIDTLTDWDIQDYIRTIF